MESASGDQRARSSRRLAPEHVAAGTVALIATLAFLPSIGAGFIFDDRPLIAGNEFVHSWRWLPRAFTTHFWDIGTIAEDVRGGAEAMRRYYRPLVTVSYLVTWMIAGAKPWAFHLGNVLLHGANAGLVTRAATRWTGSLRLGVGVALLFALHPTRTEAVTWISGRTDVLMLFFVLLALEAFVLFERRRAEGVQRAWLALAAGLLATTAAVLSKEPAALLPFLVLAEPRATGESARRPWLVPAVTGGPCSAYLLGRILFWAPEGEGIQRLFTPGHALFTIGLYVERAVMPWPPTMYYRALESGPSGLLFPPPILLLGGITLLAGIVALGYAWRRSKTAFWLIVSAGAFMGPLLNFYFTGLHVSAQDRFLYAPLLFVVAGGVVLLREPLLRVARRRVVALALAGAGLAAVLLVEIRGLDYRDERTFWEAELEHQPDHPFILAMLGREAASAGELDAAYAYYRRAELPAARKFALASDPSAHFQRAAILAALLPDGRVDELAALLDELWRIVDHDAISRHRIVLDFEVGGAIDAAQIEVAIRNSPSLYSDIALLATRLGDRPRAERALALVPALTHGANPLNDALALSRLGRLADARALERGLAERSAANQDVVTRDALRELSTRLDRVEEIRADDVSGPAARDMADALRLAELGAYLAALRVLERGGLLDSPEAAPLVAQLLIACRLDDAARVLVARRVGPERAGAIVSGMIAALPPRLREMPAAPGGLEDALARAAAAAAAR